MRGIIGLVVIAALVAAAVFFADHPGQVAIAWQGWRVETSVGVLVAAAAAAALTAAFAFRLLSRLLGSPRAFLRHRREQRRRAGYRALTQGMVAVAAGDPREAQRFARRADQLLADPPLTLLLSAQAAQLCGDEAAARRFFSAMLDRPETEFLGLRGLLNQALRSGDRSTALHLAERAMTLRPSAHWVVESLFDLEVRERRWEAAWKTLGQAAKRRIVPPECARHRRGVILHERSRATAETGDRHRATDLAAQAQGLTPDLATPAAHHAKLLLQDRQIRRAARAVERAWRSAPHPELARVYGEIHGDQPALARVKSFERLAAQNPAARESSMALAEAALDAQLWGEARRHLELALAAAPPPALGKPAAECVAGPTPRLCLMMARLEEAEHHDAARVREWLDRAVNAMPDPRYVCASCGGECSDWGALCPHCGSFDALAWRTPAWAGSGATLPVTAVPRSMPKLPASHDVEVPAGNPHP
jgi:HemY protein